MLTSMYNVPTTVKGVLGEGADIPNLKKIQTKTQNLRVQPETLGRDPEFLGIVGEENHYLGFFQGRLM